MDSLTNGLVQNVTGQIVGHFIRASQRFEDMYSIMREAFAEHDIHIMEELKGWRVQSPSNKIQSFPTFTQAFAYAMAQYQIALTTPKPKPESKYLIKEDAHKDTGKSVTKPDNDGDSTDG